MTKILYSFDDKKLELKIEGHSGFDINGKDIVCAGVSTLAFTLINTVENYFDNGYLCDKANIKIKNAFVGVTIFPQMRYYEKCKEAYDIICLGFEMLKSKYPEYVSFSSINADS